MGRPRCAETAEVRLAIEEWVASGQESFTIPELVISLCLKLSCSHATAYRLLHRRCRDGVIFLPGFGKGPVD